MTSTQRQFGIEDTWDEAFVTLEKGRSVGFRKKVRYGVCVSSANAGKEPDGTCPTDTGDHPKKRLLRVRHSATAWYLMGDARNVVFGSGIYTRGNVWHD